MYEIIVCTHAHKNYSYTVRINRNIEDIIKWHQLKPSTVSVIARRIK